MRTAILVVVMSACSRSPKATREPLTISDTCTLTSANRVLDETGTDVGVFDRAAREVTVGSLRVPVRFTKKPDGIVVELQGLGPFIVHVRAEDITIENANVTKPLVARLSGFHGNWLELAALVTAIPILPVHEQIDAGVGSGAAGPEVPPPPPPPPPH